MVGKIMYNVAEELTNNLVYIVSQSSSDIWTYLATVVAPIVSSLAILFGGIFALYKYNFSKNYEINQKILHEVYVPLYAYIVKQETFRFIAPQESDLSFNENPIIEIKNTKTSTKQKLNGSGVTSFTSETKGVCGCTSDDFIEISEKTNFGLASTELVTLLNMYKMLIYLTSGNLVTEEKAKAIVLRHKVELALVQEILEGYEFYHKKLKLRKGFINIYKTTNKRFKITQIISKEEINDELSSLNEN